jgi:ubiquinone/menaquinone biosynthesis C-methylase UbiE
VLNLTPAPRTRRVTLAATAVVAALSCAGLLWGAVTCFPQSARASENNHYQATSQRKFGNVDYWKKIFDDPERAAWQRPQELVKALSLVPGMTVADVGAGTGYFSRFLSEAVGETGTVFAVDVEPNLVSYLRGRAEVEKTSNVVPVLASKDNPRLPTGTVDMALIIDTYHHVDDRFQYLRRLKDALSPNGRVAVIDWKQGELPVGPKDEAHKIPRDTVVGEMTGAGYKLVEEPDILPHQYYLIFQAGQANTNIKGG